MSYSWAVNKTISKNPEHIENLKSLSNIKFIFDKEHPIEGYYSCFRINIGRKYYIAKSRTCMWLESHLNRLLKAYNMNGIDGKDLYFPIVKQIHNTGYYDVSIEFICQSDNPYEVIKAEYVELHDNVGKSLCLNKNRDPYTPKWDANKKMFGWLTKNQFLNYKKFVKSRK